MKASAVIAKLNSLIAEHGDLETLYECGEDLPEIEDIEINDAIFLESKTGKGSHPCLSL
jgi:hypothetical protein